MSTFMLTLAWNLDGVVGRSWHQTPAMLVRYLKHLHDVGDEIEVLQVRELTDFEYRLLSGHPLLPPLGVRVEQP